jgi:hypothetical protein
MKPEVSLPCCKQLTTDPYPELDESNPQTQTLFSWDPL